MLYGGKRAVFVDSAISPYATVVFPGGVVMGDWKGSGDSRPEASRPKAGGLDRMGPAKKVSYNPTGSEAFGDKVGGK